MNKYLRIPFRPRRQRPSLPASPGDFAPPPGVRFVRGEDVLLLTVALPRMSAAQRRAAVAFAAEDQIARPLDEVHVALGPEMQPGLWLAGVVARTALPKDIAAGHRVLPDTLALPIPAPEHWSVWEGAGRVLVRLPDGTGFATRLPAFAVLHAAASSPAITLFAGSLPANHATSPLPPMALPASFDLNAAQGRNPALSPGARRIVAISGLAALGHLAILGADTFTLARQQAALADSLRATANAPATTDTDALLASILTAPKTAADTGFLPLLATTFAALAPQSGTATLRDLRFDAAQNSLVLTFEAADLGTLQQVETSLASAGLNVVAGPATSANGAAEQQLALQGPAP